MTALLLSTAGAHAQTAGQNGNNFFGNLFKPPGQVQQPAPVNPQMDAGELTLRADRLENQIRTLTGQVEELQYRNQQLEAQLRRYQEAGGQPVGGAAPVGAPMGAPMGAPAATLPRTPQPGAAPAYPQASATQGGYPATQPGIAPAPGAPVSPVAGTANGTRRSDAFDPNAQPGAPGAPRPLGTTPPSQPIGVGTPMDIGGLGETGAPAPGGTQLATLPPSSSPKDTYDLAYGYILQQQYPQAEEALRAFLAQYPNDRMAPDATYWLGETQFQRKQYKDAAEQYLKVSTSYPNSTKAPDSLLRLGQSLASIGEQEAACATFGEIGRKYPRATTNVKQAVEREQKRGHC